MDCITLCVTVTGVTVSGEACTIIYYIIIFLKRAFEIAANFFRLRAAAAAGVECGVHDARASLLHRPQHQDDALVAPAREGGAALGLGEDRVPRVRGLLRQVSKGLREGPFWDLLEVGREGPYWD